jgi:hypothetical protein
MKAQPSGVLGYLSSDERKLDDLFAEGRADGMKQEEFARELYSLWQEGKVQISEPSPPKGFSGYMFGVRGLWFFGILAVVASVSLLIYAMPAIEVMSYIRYILGVTFVLYLPGYVVVEALYANRKDLDEPERLVLSVGLSLAFVPLLALILAYTPWGVSLSSVVSLFSAFVVAFGLLAAQRSFEQIKGGSSQ